MEVRFTGPTIMRKIFLLFVIPALLAAPARAVAGELKLNIHNGLVTLTADNVPLSTIMAEWARVGQTRVVNGDKILTPVSLQIVDMPERKALDILLRAASGYMAAERPIPMASASVFDRIMILPSSRPPVNTGPSTTPAPMFNPRPVPTPPAPDMDDEDVNVAPPGMNPQPGNVPPAGPIIMPNGVPWQQPQGPMTAPRPGQLPLPAPQQPVPFGTPPKPGGGGGGGILVR